MVSVNKDCADRVLTRINPAVTADRYKMYVAELRQAHRSNAAAASEFAGKLPGSVRRPLNPVAAQLNPEGVCIDTS